jgi:hypothetical protein
VRSDGRCGSLAVSNGGGAVLFVGYRRADEPYAVGLLAAMLVERFPQRVFLDTIANRRNRQVGPTLRAALDGADGFLCVIGPRWDDASNRVRLGKHDDWVRQELQAAIRRKLRITVGLVERTHVPRPPELPTEVVDQLATARSFVLHRSDFAVGARRLLLHLQQEVPGLGDGIRGQPEVALGPATVRTGIDAMLRHTLPLPQQATGNLKAVVAATVARLRSGEWLLDLTTGHLPGKPSGSAVVVLTDRRLLIADLAGGADPPEVPLSAVVGVEVVPRHRLWRRTADLHVHRAGGGLLVIEGLFREPAQRLGRSVHDRL